MMPKFRLTVVPKTVNCAADELEKMNTEGPKYGVLDVAAQTLDVGALVPRGVDRSL